jgi:hypothetical protein
MSIYYSQNIYSLFNNIISHNNKNVNVSGEFNISISNKYYLFILNNSDIYNNIFDFLFDNNPTDEVKSNFTNSMDIVFDNEQILKIDLQNYNIVSLNNLINNLINISTESESELIIYLDINHIINFIKNSTIETHIFDFLIHKLKNKADRLYIYENENLKNSLFIKEIFTIKKNYKFVNNNNNSIYIYKLNDINIKYWNIFNLDINNLDLSDYSNSSIKIFNYNNNEFLLTQINISDLSLNNIISHHNNFVLHPLDKINIIF